MVRRHARAVNSSNRLKKEGSVELSGIKSGISFQEADLIYASQRR